MSEAFTYAELVGWALGTAPDDRELVDRARAELVRGAKNYNGETWWAEADLLVRIDAIYPDDPGLLVAAMLHRIELTPGEAVYLDAGTLHAYIGGLGVEVMANSDNVLRGGLTPKHIDVPSLLDTLRDDTVDVEILTPDDAGTYATPAAEFSLSVVSPGQTPTVSGPAVVLATAGRTSVTNIEDDQTLTIDPTEAVWLAAGDRGVVDTADQAFIARPGT